MWETEKGESSTKKASKLVNIRQARNWRGKLVQIWYQKKEEYLAAVEIVIASASSLAPHSKMKWTATKGWLDEM